MQDVAVRSPSTARTAPDSLVLSSHSCQSGLQRDQLPRTSSHKQGRANPMMVTHELLTHHYPRRSRRCQAHVAGRSRKPQVPRPAQHSQRVIVRCSPTCAVCRPKPDCPAHVVCEGTGGYERAVVRRSARRGSLPPACTTPRGCVRSPAPRAVSPRPTLLDAAVLSDFGAAMQPVSRPTAQRGRGGPGRPGDPARPAQGTRRPGSPARRAPPPSWR